MKKNGKYNRYIFLKKINRKSIILIKGKNKYYSYGKDLEILKFINFNMEYINSSLSYLDRYNINYIVLDNLGILKTVNNKDKIECNIFDFIFFLDLNIQTHIIIYGDFMTYTNKEINAIYEDALSRNITNKKVSKIKDILYEISDISEFNVFSYHKLIYTLSAINKSSLSNLSKLRELYNLVYKDNEDLPNDFFVVSSLINVLYTDYSRVKKKEFKRLTEDMCFMYPSCNSVESIDLIKSINPVVGNLISESRLFFENRPSKYGNVMYAYNMNIMFSEMMVVFLENIEYYEYNYSLPSRVIHSLLENKKESCDIVISYSKCKDVHLFIKALFNVYKKENGMMFPKEKEEIEKKKCILLS